MSCPACISASGVRRRRGGCHAGASPGLQAWAPMQQARDPTRGLSNVGGKGPERAYASCLSGMRCKTRTRRAASQPCRPARWAPSLPWRRSQSPAPWPCLSLQRAPPARPAEADTRPEVGRQDLKGAAREAPSNGSAASRYSCNASGPHGSESASLWKYCRCTPRVAPRVYAGGSTAGAPRAAHLQADLRHVHILLDLPLHRGTASR